MDQAINLFQKSISLNSNVASTHYILGNLLGEKGEPSRAFKAYQKAIVLNPKHAEAHCKIGDIYQEQGN
jgi:tetratricopeptide (TPR) repeat protein